MPRREEQLAERIKHAMEVFAAHQPTKRTSHAEFGKAVAEEEQLRQPYAAEHVWQWMTGDRIPSLPTLLAIGELAGYKNDAQFGQLVYGDQYSIHALDEEDFRRFYRGLQIDPASRSAP